MGVDTLANNGIGGKLCRRERVLPERDADLTPAIAAQPKQRKVSMRNVKFVIGLIVLTFMFCSWLCGKQGKALSGKVISVHDGDTITILSGTTKYKIRLFGVDCPELGQPFGQNARQFTAGLVFGKTVKVFYSSKDRYRRYLGTVHLPNGKILNRELVANGMAWHYAQYSDDPITIGLQVKAKAKKLGLWRDSNAIAPWQWRQAERE